jgi:hypothetical protein
MSNFFNSLLHPGSGAKKDDGGHCETSHHPKPSELPLSISEAITVASSKERDKVEKKEVEKDKVAAVEGGSHTEETGSEKK